jgi:FkbM family methyltransferase
MVTTIYSFLKNRALNFLPDSLLQPLRVWHQRRVLRSFGDADEPDLTIVRKLVQRGTIAVDLGANFGVYTKVLSDLVGPTGLVISVEPVPQTFEVLSRNIRSLGMTNVSCVNVAISDLDGDVLMGLPNYDSGGINFYQAAIVGEGDDRIVHSGRHVRVPALRLDTVVAGKGTVGFVKCDVEGHELACLSGAEMVLNSHSPAWLVEVSGNPDEPGTKAMQVFRIFENLSYGSWWFDGNRLNERRNGDRSTNYFFLKAAHLDRLRRTVPELFGQAPTRAQLSV